MEQVETITFEDLGTKSEAVAIVRRDVDKVALCLSILVDGDIEVFMKREDARKLLEALRAALT